jgi:hypothetical protein
VSEIGRVIDGAAVGVLLCLIAAACNASEDEVPNSPTGLAAETLRDTVHIDRFVKDAERMRVIALRVLAEEQFRPDEAPHRLSGMSGSGAASRVS